MCKQYNSNLEPFVNFTGEEAIIESISNENVAKFFNNSTEYIYRKITFAATKLFELKLTKKAGE